MLFMQPVGTWMESVGGAKILEWMCLLTNMWNWLEKALRSVIVQF